jgi:transcription-repair coupling factor (superfamily II helicase)
VSVELPIEAHLPLDYVSSERLRLEMYKHLAAVRTLEDVESLRAEMVDRYGEPPEAVEALLDVARLRVRLREAGVGEVTSAGSNIRFAGLDLPESAQMRLKRVYNGLYKQPARMALVPHPKTAAIGGRPIAGRDLIEWVHAVVDAMVPPAA